MLSVQESTGDQEDVGEPRMTLSSEEGTKQPQETQRRREGAEQSEMCLLPTTQEGAEWP